MKNLAKTIVCLIVCFVCSNQAIQAQTTAFTYQGKLNDGGVAANGLYDFTFTIYGSSVGGIPVSGDLAVGDVQVTNGIFTVNLDFGASPFNSPTDNHLEIAVRPGASVGVYTTLSPRQRLTSSPYSIKTLSAVSADSLSAACVSCVTNANIETVGANKITGVLSFFQGGTGFGGTFLPAGVFLRSNGAGWEANGLLASDIPTNLGSYIQNTTTTQATSNFNISGSGTANIFNAATQYNLGGNRVLSVAGIGNLVAGVSAGQSNTGSFNAFFGAGAGLTNMSGTENSFFGYTTGRNNSSGDANSFFGKDAGFANTTGRLNSFFGYNAGRLNTLGSDNTFFGVNAGDTNTTGNKNTIIGSNADVASATLSFATAIGADAVVSSSNTVVLGRNLDTVQIPGNLNVAGNFTGSFTVSAGSITGVLARLNGGTGLNSSGAAGNFLRSDGTNWTSSALQVSDIPNLNTSYIQNIPGIGQQTGSFNITGGGTANIFNSTNGYNIGGSLILSSPGVDNLFAGRLAGISTTSGSVNSFFGYRAGEGNVGGSSNSFFGERSGLNSEAVNNSFFGAVAGQTNVNGSNNTLIGTLTDVSSANLNFATALGAGAVVSTSNTIQLGRTNGLDTVRASGNLFANTIAAATQFNIGSNRVLSVVGTENIFAGVEAGQSNTTGNNNSFFGNGAGLGNTTGYANAFFGAYAGFQNTTGRGITLIGSGANIGFTNLFNATAIGVNAVVSQNNSLVLGAFLNGFDTKVGIGTSAPGYRLDVVGRSRFKQESGFTGTGASAGFWFFQNTPNADQAFVGMENDNSVGLYGNNGGNWGLVMNTQTGVTSVKALGAAGSTNLCRNANNEISTCSSSIRYKQNINTFDQGLSLIKQLRPVSFNWRANNQADLGLVAEEVASVEPLLTTINEKGEVEGVKYDRVGVVLVNAVQEQQAQIEAQARQIEEQKALIRQQQEKADKQQTEINAMKILVCSQNPTAELCKPKEK